MSLIDKRKKIALLLIVAGVFIFLFSLIKQINVFLQKDFSYVSFISHNILFFSPTFLLAIVFISLGQFFFNPAKFVERTEKTRLKSKNEKITLFIVVLVILTAVYVTKRSISNHFSSQDIIWGIRTLLRFFCLSIILPFFFWIVGLIVTKNSCTFDRGR